MLQVLVYDIRTASGQDLSIGLMIAGTDGQAGASRTLGKVRRISSSYRESAQATARRKSALWQLGLSVRSPQRHISLAQNGVS